MPRFFFNLTDGDRLADEEGLALPDADQAMARASVDLRRYAAQMLGDEADLSLVCKIEVTDTLSGLVGLVDLTSIVNIRQE